MSSLSPRLQAIVDALPLRPDSRVLEIGCGPRAAARAVAARLDTGRSLAGDRSATAIERMRALAADQIASGRMAVRCVAAKDLEPEPDEAPYDLVGVSSSTAGTRSASSRSPAVARLARAS